MIARRGIVRVLPLGNGGWIVEPECTVVEQDADQRVDHRLGHRPGQERSLGRHRLVVTVPVLDHTAVAFVDQSTLMDDDGGERRAEPRGVGVDLVDQRFEIDAVGYRAFRPSVGGPGHVARLGRQRHVRCGERVGHRASSPQWDH